MTTIRPGRRFSLGNTTPLPTLAPIQTIRRQSVPMAAPRAPNNDCLGTPTSHTVTIEPRPRRSIPIARHSNPHSSHMPIRRA
jgi:hypothetical protein